VQTNEMNNLAGFLFPGSKVDVLATLRGENNKSYNRTVAQNVQVLSAGDKIVANPDGKPENVKVVTLLVTPDDSQKLALAMEQGKIQLAMRNQSDAQKVESPTISSADLEPLPEKPVVRSTAMRKSKVEPAPIAFYTVETIAGTKSSIAKFLDGAAQ
jgi:pilus assembly protein CpaB